MQACLSPMSAFKLLSGLNNNRELSFQCIVCTDPAVGLNVSLMNMTKSDVEKRDVMVSDEK